MAAKSAAGDGCRVIINTRTDCAIAHSQRLLAQSLRVAPSDLDDLVGVRRPPC